MVEHPQILNCLFIVRYVHSASFTVYGFGLLRLHSSPLDENYLCVLWFTSFGSMAPIVKIEPNGPQTLLSHDDVMSKLSHVGWLEFIQSFNGFNLEVARAFAKNFDGNKAKIGDVQIQVTEEFIAKAMGLPQKGER